MFMMRGHTLIIRVHDNINSKLMVTKRHQRASSREILLGSWCDYEREVLVNVSFSPRYNTRNYPVRLYI